jgi:hypothetical protein
MPDTASQSYILIAQESVERTRAVVEDTRKIVDGSLRAIAKSRELIEKLSGTAELARQGKSRKPHSRMPPHKTRVGRQVS